MSLKFVIDALDGVPAPLREHYTAKDGKFTLSLEGEHPDTTKVAEFRSSNIQLMKDKDALRAALEQRHPDETQRLSELEAALAAEKTARADAQAKADRGLLRDTLRSKALAAGVLPAALDMFLDKAEPVFTVVNDAVQARPNTFSKSRPGELLSPDEWIVDATKEFPFLFGRSSGGGADPKPGLFGGGSNVKELRDPTPQQLGEHAAAISRGELKVVYSS
jgi:hypothetical protein